MRLQSRKYKYLYCRALDFMPADLFLLRPNVLKVYLTKAISKDQTFSCGQRPNSVISKNIIKIKESFKKCTKAQKASFIVFIETLKSH